MSTARSIGLGLLATTALSAALAGTASAALPELGRCEAVQGVQEGKKVVYHGAYANKGCTKASASGKGKYEFLAGPGPQNKFAAVAQEPEPVLETVGGAKIVCSDAAFKGGEYTGPKTEKIATVTFAGCETAPGKPCQSNPAKEGEIESGQALEGELGTIAGGTRPTVGWDLKHSGTIFTFTCGKLPEVQSVQTIEGSVIGQLSPSAEGDVNRMSIYSFLKFKMKAGRQLPEAFEAMPKDTLTTSTTTASLSKTVEQTGLTATFDGESGLGEPIEKPANQEPLEIKTIP